MYLTIGSQSLLNANKSKIISLVQQPNPSFGLAIPQLTTPSTMENGTTAAAQGEGKDPSGFLSEIIGNPVTVKLNSGVIYRGKR